MRKKALVLGLALALALSQAALAVGAGSITVSNGSGGPNKSDLTTDTITSINGETGQTTVTVINAGETTTTTTTPGGSTTTTTTASQDTVNAPTLSIAGGPATGESASAAPEVSQTEVAAQTASLSGYNTSVTNTYADYAIGASNAINAVNANPAALASLPSTENLSQYVMLTGFQEVNVADAQTGEKITPAAGQCVAISVPALMPGMRVYLLYVDPLTCMTVKVEAKGVDYANQQVLVDASVPGAFSIVYER